MVVVVETTESAEQINSLTCKKTNYRGEEGCVEFG